MMLVGFEQTGITCAIPNPSGKGVTIPPESAIANYIDINGIVGFQSKECLAVHGTERQVWAITPNGFQLYLCTVKTKDKAAQIIERIWEKQWSSDPEDIVHIKTIVDEPLKK